MAINPDLEAAAEISRILQFPLATRVESFSHGRVDLVTYHIPEGSNLDGLRLKNIGARYKAKVLICVVERGEDVLIPNGEYTLKSGDFISIAGPQQELRSFFMNAGAYKSRCTMSSSWAAAVSPSISQSFFLPRQSVSLLSSAACRNATCWRSFCPRPRSFWETPPTVMYSWRRASPMRTLLSHFPDMMRTTLLFPCMPGRWV